MRRRHTSSSAIPEDLKALLGAIKTYYSLSREWPVPDALLLREMQLGPELIVVGTESKSHLDRFLLGSTAEHLIRKALAPVLAVGPNAKPPKEPPRLFETILYATDFSDASNRAGRLALGLAHQTGAHLWICHVTGAKSGTDHTRRSDGVSEEEFRDQLAGLIPPEAYDWCTPECTAAGTHPAEGILHAADSVRADLIIMGARERSFWLMHIHAASPRMCWLEPTARC